MKKKSVVVFLIIFVCIFVFALKYVNSEPNGRLSAVFEKGEQAEIPDKLVVVWSSGDREVALKMVFMYTIRSKQTKRWGDVRLLVWGPSAKLLSIDTELQDYAKRMKEAGVELLACKACADMYEVSDKLNELGVEVKYMGTELTNMIKSGWTTLTF